MDAKKHAERNAAEIDARLEIIKAKTWAKVDKVTNWAQAGDVGHVLELVKEIENFLEGKG